MLKGKIVKAAGGFFSVQDESGKEHVCRARGALKRGNKSLMVGDNVVFDPVEEDPAVDGIIEEMLPRSNRLDRPPVANLDQLAVIMSIRHPDCDWQLASRMFVLAEKEGLAAFLCLNKTDLTPAGELENLPALLCNYPYRVIYTSAVERIGLESLKENLEGQCSVLAGPSGVGKSTLLNAIQPGLTLKTGTVSDKIKRGRHTTRQAELLPLAGGGSVVDTPGFTRLDFKDIEADQLSFYFPEFEPLIGKCGFRDCRHISEPRCAVREQVGARLNPMRYDHYRYFMNELEKQEVY